MAHVIFNGATTMKFGVISVGTAFTISQAPGVLYRKAATGTAINENTGLPENAAADLDCTIIAESRITITVAP